MSPPDPIESVRSYMLTEASAYGVLNIMFERKIGRSPDMSPGASSDDEDRWSALQASNPRLHDGPILSVNIFDSPIRSLSCRLDSYKRFAIQESKRQQTTNHEDPFDIAGVWLLGVKGWIIAEDRTGEEHVLIARRGPDTRIYGMMWESAPAGGVPPPSQKPEAAAVEITTAMLQHSLAAECEEELGLDLDWTGAMVIGITQDSIARSYDIHCRLDLSSTINPNHAPVCSAAERSWEYVDTAWLSRQDAEQFDRTSSDAITPPTRAMLRLMGWVHH